MIRALEGTPEALNHGPHALTPSKCFLNPHLPQPPGPPANQDPFGLESVSPVCRQMHPDHTMAREVLTHVCSHLQRTAGPQSPGPRPPDLPSLHLQLSTAGDTWRGLVRDISAHPRPSGPGQRCPPRTPSRGLGKAESHTCRKLEFFPPSLFLWISGLRDRSGDRRELNSKCRELNSKCDPLWFQTQVLSPHRSSVSPTSLLILTFPVYIQHVNLQGR